MKQLEARAMHKNNWGVIGLYWIDTTELESYKQVEPRDEGKKLGFAKRTGSSFSGMLEIEILQFKTCVLRET